MMKSVFSKFLIISLSLVVLNSCTDDDDKPIGEPFDKTEGLTATAWIIEQVFLVDEGNPAKPERNLSEFYVFNENKLEMKFNTDATFVVTPGEGLNFFPTSGTWAFDDDFAPRQIILTDNDGVQTIAPLGGPTRISDSQLKLNFVKRSCNSDEGPKAVLGYRLVFNRKS